MNRLRALAAQRDRGRLPVAQPALTDAAEATDASAAAAAEKQQQAAAE
jgi:hypothetical protein